MPSPQRRFHPEHQRCLSFLEEDKLSIRFRRFHEARPDVYAALVRLAYKAKERGFDRYSIKGLIEVARFDLGLRDINNSFGAHYSRLIMQNEPALDGFFETRKQTAA